MWKSHKHKHKYEEENWETYNFLIFRAFIHKN